jgi:hypothetical protein
MSPSGQISDRDGRLGGVLAQKSRAGAVTTALDAQQRHHVLAPLDLRQLCTRSGKRSMRIQI